MSSFQKKALKVTEKFRAQAALYSPSTNEGDGWIEVSGPLLGGEAIIQLQEDAKRKSTIIPVFRFQLRHGKDVVNARIEHTLPIYRKADKEVLFKCVSSNSGGLRRKTVYALKFQTKDNTDDFMMWWLAKNRSISLGLESKETALKKKRKIKWVHGSRYTPLKKKMKPDMGVVKDLQHEQERKNLISKHKEDKEAENKESEGSVSNVSSKNLTSNKREEKVVKETTDTSGNGCDSSIGEDDEVYVDDECAPQSQDWSSAFSFENN